MMQNMPNDHIDNKTLAAFLDDALDADEKREVLNHLRRCEECRLKMAEISIFLEELASKPAGGPVPGGEATAAKPANNPYLKVLKYAAPFVAAGVVAILVIPMSNVNQVAPVVDEAQSSAAPVEKSAVDMPPPMVQKSYGISGPSPTRQRYVPEEPEMLAASPESYDRMDTPLVGATPYREEMEEDPLARLESVYFAEDGYELNATMKATIAVNVELIREGDYNVILEGHADSSHPREYSLALAERYASAVKTYMISLGVEPKRIMVISFGKERPACMEESGECRAENRRVDFMLER